MEVPLTKKPPGGSEMPGTHRRVSAFFFRVLLVLGIGLTLSACTPNPGTQEIFDPNEAANRRIHEFNRKVDRIILRPTSTGYGFLFPRPLRLGLNNFSQNLDQPRIIVNNVLQGDAVDFGHNFFRFLMNSTLGVGGLFDPATSLGLEERPADFGQTLHVWGANEGAFMEIAFFGPSTQRDAAGIVIDALINPLRLLSGAQARIALGAEGFSLLGDRYAFSDTVDSILYESADSYAQLRIIYLQSRRFELGDGGNDSAFIDPYEDPYDDF